MQLAGRDILDAKWISLNRGQNLCLLLLPDRIDFLFRLLVWQRLARGQICAQKTFHIDRIRGLEAGDQDRSEKRFDIEMTGRSKNTDALPI